MKQPDPSDFTGKKTSEKSGKPEGNIITKTGGRIKDKAYNKLGIKSETGKIDKKRRNLIAAIGGGVGAGVIGYQAAQNGLNQEIKDLGEIGGEILNGDCENTGYGIKKDIIEESDMYQVGVMQPNSEHYFMAWETSEDEWMIEGYVPEVSGSRTVKVDEEEINKILNKLGNEYEKGEDIIEVCLD